MASYKDIEQILKSDEDLVDLGYSNSRMRNLMLDLIEHRIDNFNYNSTNNYNYLLKIFDYFPYYFEKNFKSRKEFYLRIKTIRDKVKTLLIQKPGTISKNTTSFQFLKNVIDNLETVSLSLLYDYIDKYDGSKYEFINFLVFEVKRISLIEDAIKRFPYIVNFETKEGDSLIDRVIKSYIDEVKICVNNSENLNLDNVMYYDEILKLLLASEKLSFNILKQNNWHNYINKLIENVDILNLNSFSKQKYIFYLNDLSNQIRKNDIANLEYLKYKYDINSSFNYSINLECDRVLNKHDNISNRQVIKDEVILTFDGKDAKEIDDALSIKILENGNYLLGVHIADPMYFLDTNGIIYDEAKRRTTSIYLSDMTVSMFPSKLSSEAASLIGGKMRPAISYYYEITKDSEVVKQCFYKSYILIYKNMTYVDFNDILEHGCEDKKIYETIVNLANIQPILSSFYRIDPCYQKINRVNNNITDTNITGNSVSEKLVESAMVFNNHMVASYFAKNKLPFIYRVHAIDSKTIERIEEFSKTISLEENDNKYLKYINVIKNIYPQAVYSLNNKGHFGLGIDAYAHVTSPLRRFSDILASECLDKLYFNDFVDKDVYKMEEKLKSSIENVNQKRLSIEMFSANYEKNKHNF